MSTAEEFVANQRRTVELLEQLLAVMRAQKPKGNSDSLALTLRRAERLLGVHRSTLSEHVSLGNVRVVAWGTGRRIPKDEIDRLLREGLPALPGETKRALPPGTKRRPSPRRPRAEKKKQEGTPGDRIRALDV